ncbi:indole-3-glycerol phosphate synthase TrpC [Cronbergia sp. UHCC 0137]|uniref:indole-3-glycerol phosphate synthase TrpC n=1 Tax=Cronbergia sp. UHCC 0137 TaxID=3110239 RepID=UPI002B1E93F6|nr:indole-3-glycerol phosphate synthase TrpC [Cronbergia sp. UHCC 0137]MEA5619770.1 indole-3-glycerol phosphate synthase TrpC [Cronbergia sp. UHCC 0137]
MTYPSTIYNNRLQSMLKEIVWQKKLEVEQIQKEMSLASLQRQLTAAPTVRDLFTAIQQSLYRPSLIAEIRKTSLNQEIIRTEFEPIAIAKAYEGGGATCISVVTDQKFFQGGFEHLRAIRYRVTVPLLCKDFILNPCQIYLARAAGADAVLLIAAILTDQQIQNLTAVIHYLGMNAVIEVNNLAELDRVLKLDDTRIITINNRSWEDFTVDINITEQLMAQRRSHIQNLGILVLSESGIENSADLAFVADAGVNAVIMGEPLLKQEDITAAVRNFLKPDFPIYKDLLKKRN